MTKITLRPKQIFLVDGLGALLSAFLLGVVLVRYQATFGIPVNTLYFLAALPVFFAAFDFFIFFSVRKSLSTSFKIIAFANLIYCGISIGLGIYHQDQLTAYGWGYLILEVLVVVALALNELRLSK